MKKFIIKTVIIGLLAWAMQYLTVWYAGPLVAMLVNVLWKGSSWQGFLTGFLGLGILWCSLAIYVHNSTGGILSNKMAYVLPLGGNVAILITVTTFIGALCGGLCGWTGAMARKLKD